MEPKRNQRPMEPRPITRKQHPQGHRPPSGSFDYPIQKNANIVGTALLLYYGLSFLLSYLGVHLIRWLLERNAVGDRELLIQVVSLACYVVSFLGPWLFIRKWTRIPLRIAFPSRIPRLSIALPGTLFCLGASIVGGLLSTLVYVLCQFFIGVTPFMGDMNPPKGQAAAAVYVLSVAVAPAILEEMLFRGAIMQSLRRYGDQFALVVSAILFAVVHGNLVQAPNAFVMGLAMGYFVLRTGSLWMGIIIHGVNNGMVVLLNLLVQHTTAVQDNMLYTARFLVYLVGGVLSMLYLLASQPNSFRIYPSAYPIREARKYMLFFTSVMVILAMLFSGVVIARHFQ